MTAFCKEFDLSLQEMQKPFCHSCRSQSTQQSVLVSFGGFRHLMHPLSGAGLVHTMLTQNHTIQITNEADVLIPPPIVSGSQKLFS